MTPEKKPLPRDGRKRSAGNAAWLRGVDAGRIDIELHGRLSPSELADVSLRSGDDVLVSRDERPATTATAG